jgi:hypothetical protein
MNFGSNCYARMSSDEKFRCARKSISHGKAAAWFQPHCGIPGQLEIGWYLNRAGVLTVEHPVPKMDSGQLPESGFVRLGDVGRTCHGSLSSPQCSRPPVHCGLERRSLKSEGRRNG